MNKNLELPECKLEMIDNYVASVETSVELLIAVTQIPVHPVRCLL